MFSFYNNSHSNYILNRVKYGLKTWAANFFYPPTIPWKIEYKDKPKKKKKHHFKQPKANMGYKRGQRR